MFGLEKGMRIYVSTQPIDMRKGIDSLYNLVITESPLNPVDGGVFVWFGKNRKSCKILRWYGDSILLYTRRLARGTFELPRVDGQTGYCQLDWTVFSLVMEGIVLGSAKARSRYVR